MYSQKQKHLKYILVAFVLITHQSKLYSIREHATKQTFYGCILATIGTIGTNFFHKKSKNRIPEDKVLFLKKKILYSTLSIFAGALSVFGVSLALWSALAHAEKNRFYSVEEEQLYRSAQMSRRSLESAIKSYNIKTIINLRGKNPKESWWQKEHNIASKNNIDIYDIPMSANRLPRKKDLSELLYLYDHAKRPILIHCQAGVDRTGEAAAIWKLDQQNKSKREALKQLSWKFRHFGQLHPSKKFLIKNWQGREWARKFYDPYDWPKYYYE